MEEWRDIKGYEGLYQVSNMGMVKSLDRYISYMKSFKKIKEKILKPRYTKSGYNQVHLNKSKLIKEFYIHRLVAQAFIPNPLQKETVNHINGVKSDNNVNNLEWNTRSENTIHAYKNGLMKNCTTKKHKPVLMLSLDDEPLLWFDSIKEASKMVGVNQGNISRVCNNNALTSSGYKWQYYKGVRV